MSIDVKLIVFCNFLFFQSHFFSPKEMVKNNAAINILGKIQRKGQYNKKQGN